MPEVTLIGSNGVTRRASGGCFGFTGRSSTPTGYGAITDFTAGQSVIETYRYHIGKQWDSKPQEGLFNPVPYLKWLAYESSWAKYIKGINFPNDQMTNTHDCYIDIRTDIPGHCVIGTASAARLASHRHNKLIPFWNLAVNAGADGAIALLVYYSLGPYVHNDYTISPRGVLNRNKLPNQNLKNVPTSSSGQLSLSDDEVMDLSNVSPGLIYSFISGDFEMMRNDSSETLYQDRPIYAQNILNSFRSRSSHSNRKNFGMFLLHRFHTTLTGPDIHRFSSGMGSNTTLTATRKAPVTLTSLIAWSLQLTSEFQQFGRFLGWRS